MRSPVMEKKKCNFTAFEKIYLLKLVKKQNNIIENKKGKKNCWEKITTSYNSLAQTGPRSTKQLKLLYQIQKRNAGKVLAFNKAKRYKAGWGKYISVITNIEEKIVDGIKEDFTPDENDFDSSSPLFKEKDNPVPHIPTSSENFLSSSPIPIASTSTVPHEVTSFSFQDDSTIKNILTLPSLVSKEDKSRTTSLSNKICTKETSQKRKHPVAKLSSIIEEPKKNKTKFDEIDAQIKKFRIEDLEGSKELHTLNVHLKQLHIQKQLLEIEGVHLDNNLKEVDLLIKQNQLDNM